jgi:hypothetical protein
MKTLICDQSNGKHCRSLDRARRIAGATRGTATASYAKNDSYDITGISRISLRNEDLRKTHDIHKLCHSRTESRPGRCWCAIVNIGRDNRVAGANRVTGINYALSDEGI